MTGAVAGFLAVGGTSLICFLLMSRAENRKAGRESVSGDSSSGGGDTDSVGGWSILSWFGGDGSSADGSDGSFDFSSGDSGGGGDGAGSGD